MEFYQGNNRVGTPEVNHIDVSTEDIGGGHGVAYREPVIEYGNEYQISIIHCLATLNAAEKYLGTVKKIKLNKQWTNVAEWIYECFTPEQIQSLTEACIVSGVLQITASDTLQPIVEWARSVGWHIRGLDSLSIDTNSVMVAARSHLNYDYWNQNLQGMKMITKKMRVNDNTVTGMIVDKAVTMIDFFGNNCGFYRLENEQGQTTVRLTHWKNGNFNEVMKSHFVDKELTITKYKGMSFIPFKKVLTTTAMNDILGAENGPYQVNMVAGDGIVQVNNQNPLRYEMKSIALIVYRSGERDNSDNDYLKLYDKDALGNITTRMIVEIIYNKIHFVSLVVTHKDVDLGD